MKHIAMIMAAGKGLRMGGEVPKQYMDLGGKPVLYYTIKAMEDSFIDEIVIVTGENDIDYIKKEYIEGFKFKKVTDVVKGGSERYESVYNGLKAISDTESYVYIQDGARPFLLQETLNKAKEAVEAYDACVVCVPVKDTIKIADEDGNVKDTPSRKTLWAAQTPQAFRYEVVRKAYDRMFAEGNPAGVTDDASVVESFSNKEVKIVEGDYTNIKITTPEDMWLGMKILEQM